MYRLWIYIFFLWGCPPWLNGQETGNLRQSQYDELKNICYQIQTENQALRSQVRNRDSLDYAAIRSQVFEAFQSIHKIDLEYLSTTDKIAVTGLFTKLLQANNPTSDILGFRFHETILKAAEKHFKNELRSEPERSRFNQVITKLVNNPIVSSLANSNPITSVTAAIISTVAGYSTTSLDIDKNGNKIKDVSAVTIDAFCQKNIDAFRSELQPYIQFYDALNTASQRYLAGLENISQRHTYLKNTVDNFKEQLYNSIQVDDSSTLIKLASVLPDPSSGKVNFQTHLKDPRVIQCYRVVSGLPPLLLTVQQFRREYDHTLLTFLKEYISALESAKKIPSAQLDQAKIECLIADIQVFMNHEIRPAHSK